MINSISLESYLILSAMIFAIGMFGLLLNRKNIINILMSIELLLLSININFVAFSSYYNDLAGQIFGIVILTIAAAETSIGLAILIVLFRNTGSIKTSDLNKMSG